VELSAVLLARVIAYIESVDLMPKGSVFFPDIVKELVKRYKFEKFPKTIEEFDETKGIEFHLGKAGERTIQKFVIWNTILVLETRSNTKDSMEILEEMLEWGAEKFHLDYHPGKIKRFAYISGLTFYSEAPILETSRPLTKLAESTSRIVSEIWQEEIAYHPMILTVGHDPQERKNGIAAFTIQRRAEAKFSENKYFSEAPLPTDVHQRLLEEYERDAIALGSK
jgi:hypothetical protein